MKLIDPSIELITKLDGDAQIEIRTLALDLLAKLKAEIPVLFDEL